MGPGGESAGIWRQVARASAAWVKGVWAETLPEPRTRKGAAAGIAIAVLGLVGYMGSTLRTSLSSPVDFAIGLVIGTLGLALVACAAWLAAWLLRTLPRFVGWTGSAGVIGFILLFVNFGLPPSFVMAGAGIALVEGLAGGALAFVSGPGFKASGRIRRSAAFVLLAAVLGVNGALGYLLVRRGSDAHLVEVPGTGSPTVAPLKEPDPSLPGPYRVARLAYGSGRDRLRPEFGRNAGLATRPVDATPFVKGFEGWREKLRRRFWGFGADAFPLNGRVWYPQGEGPFPLVLIVHGNHNMGEFSDPGYGYLGELLASRGFIFVSVDENFLNGSIIGGIPKENDARGWLLLEHLKVWRDWNRAPGHPFYRKVDMARLGLVGHSRGGEAVAIAGAFNRLSRYPDDATVRFDFGFSLRALVAIAPSDGQYNPADKPVPLEDVNYFTLQGGHDADVSLFMGDRQYNRVRFTGGDWFKASLYIYRANHGQFNTVWGDTDFPPPMSWLLNRRPLLTGEEQRRIGALYISAFLEATLRDRRGYRRLFRDHRAVEARLPRTIYVSRFEDSTFRLVSDYEEDVDVTTTSVAGGSERGIGLALWREQDMYLRKKVPRKNNAVYLGWDAERQGAPEQPRYEITLPPDLARRERLGRSSLVVFDLAEADEKLPPPKGQKEEKESKGEQQTRRPPIELTLEVVSRGGGSARVPVRIPPKLPMRFTKLSALEEKFYETTAEPVLQSFEIPLSLFAGADPRFRPEDLETIRFRFDRTKKGIVILDRVGFARAAAGTGGAP